MVCYVGLSECIFESVLLSLIGISSKVDVDLSDE